MFDGVIGSVVGLDGDGGSVDGDSVDGDGGCCIVVLTERSSAYCVVCGLDGDGSVDGSADGGSVGGDGLIVTTVGGSVAVVGESSGLSFAGGPTGGVTGGGFVGGDGGECGGRSSPRPRPLSASLVSLQSPTPMMMRSRQSPSLSTLSPSSLVSSRAVALTGSVSKKMTNIMSVMCIVVVVWSRIQ